MASILDLNSGSSDSEDDVDYVPPTGPQSDVSEDECTDDETEQHEEPSAKKIKLNDQKNETKSESATNSSAADVWKNFLKDVESTSNCKVNGKLQNEVSSSNATSQLGETSKSEGDDIKSDAEIPKEEIVPENNEAEPLLIESEKKTILEDCDDKSVSYAKSADIIEETKKVDGDVRKPYDVFIGRPRGACLSSIVGTLGDKGKKQSVLEKSLQDWRSFKEEEGIDKDLEIFNKGRQGYVERKRFLQRSDIRSFENEKNLRLSGRKK